MMVKIQAGPHAGKEGDGTILPDGRTAYVYLSDGDVVPVLVHRLEIADEEMLALRHECRVRRVDHPQQFTSAEVVALAAAIGEFPHPTTDMPKARLSRAARLRFLSWACGRPIVSMTADGQRETERCLTIGESFVLHRWFSGRNLFNDLPMAEAMERRRKVMCEFAELQAPLVIADAAADWQGAYCYCCGEPATCRRVIVASLKADLCDACALSTYAQTTDERLGKFWYLACPAHGENNKDHVRYSVALGMFNDKWGERKRGPRVRWGVNWTAELENLRQEWRERQEGPVQRSFS